MQPVPAALIAAGLVGLSMILRNNKDDEYDAERFSSATDEYGSNSFAAGSFPGPDSETSGAINEAREKAGEIVQAVGQKASDLKGQAIDVAHNAAETTEDYIMDSPLMATGIALMAGLLLGYLLPMSHRERGILKQSGDLVKSNAGLLFTGAAKYAVQNIVRNWK